MIKLKQPSLVLHSCDVPGYKYTSWQYWKMPKGASAGNLVYWMNWGIEHSPEMYLHNIVINCHGSPGFLHIGGSGVGFGDGQESVLRPLRSKGAIGRIIIVACEVAADSDGNGRLGKAFCTRIAEESGAFVLAADALQSVDFWYQVFSHPFGTIDDFEGTVYEFSPAGGHEVWIGNTAD